ncbi:hypothetical protein QQS21_005311 [Conoideocrella luteorostrata]|uniref:Fork-head domain-containing protein n=1 Tax=Conoideocrella luteorostrata TaxID=1105319 RepID=A0AAJ0G100_9HYPO|nr:hypothetical protein QQS21_005311 [Conoideocrella luteorostrata]
MVLNNTTPSSSPSSDHAYNLMTSNQLTHASRSVWPSPPLAPGELDFNYCLQDSSPAFDNTKAEYIYMPTPPNAWCSGKTTTQYHQPSQEVPNPLVLPDAYTPNSSTDLGQDGADGLLLSMSGENGNSTGHLWAGSFATPRNTLKSSPMSASSSVADSPATAAFTPEAVHHVKAEPLPPPAPVYPPSNSNRPPNSDKFDEPYAKLIYRAFMDRAGHAMTLQEIYQWFRENTAKAVAGTGGWQNSIRHNLSMNAAFKSKTKSSSKSGKATSGSEEPKRPNEWALEEWAVGKGVESTTRYRRSNYSRRGVSGRNAAATSADNALAAEYSAKRAVSGHKGGCATRVSRQRKRNYGRQLSLSHTPRHSAGCPPQPPAHPSPSEFYCYGDSRPHFNCMSYFTPIQACPVGSTDEVNPDSMPLRLLSPNYQQMVANNNNSHQANHTVSYGGTIGTYQGPSMSMAFDLGEVQRPPTGKHQDTKCSTSRHFQSMAEGSALGWCE